MTTQDTEALMKALQELNEEEQFYKAYYLAKQKKSTLSAFLSAQDADEICKRRWLVPELLGDALEDMIAQKERFDTTYAHGVGIQKHPRYMPPYEHSSPVFEILYVLSGRCIYHIFPRPLELTAGDICIVSPAARRAIEVNGDADIVMQIRVSVSTISDLFSLMLRSNNPVSSFFLHSLHTKNHQEHLLFHTAGDETMRDRILEMYQDSFTADQYTKHLLNNLLNVFFIKLVRAYPPAASAAGSKTEDRFKVVFYLINHFTDVTLEDVAREFNFSLGYCSRYIKAVTGYTFSQLKNKLKFEYVAKRLVTTNDSITDLSIGMGYENPENFIRAFKKYYGMTPTEYRKTH